MTQYIDKSALVAEIEKRIKVLQKNPYENHKTICHLDSLKQSIDTLEVKEMENSGDAFIEKALEFLDGCIPDYIDLKHANVDTFVNVYGDKLKEDFKKYMKGELL